MMNYITNYFSSIFKKKKVEVQPKELKVDILNKDNKNKKPVIKKDNKEIIFLDDTNYEILIEESVILTNYIKKQIIKPKQIKKNIVKDLFKEKCNITFEEKIQPKRTKLLIPENKIMEENKIIEKNKITIKKNISLLTPKSSKNKEKINKQKSFKKLKKTTQNNYKKKKRVCLTKRLKKKEESSSNESFNELSKSISEVGIYIEKAYKRNVNRNIKEEKNNNKKEKSESVIPELSSLDKINISSNFDTFEKSESLSLNYKPEKKTLIETYDDDNKIETYDDNKIEELESEINEEIKKEEIDCLLNKMEISFESNNLKIEEVDYNDITEIYQPESNQIEDNSTDLINNNYILKKCKNKPNLYEKAIDYSRKINEENIKQKTIIPEITRDEFLTPLDGFIIPSWTNNTIIKQDINELIKYFKDEVEDISDIFPIYQNHDSPNKLSKRFINK